MRPAAAPGPLALVLLLALAGCSDRAPGDAEPAPAPSPPAQVDWTWSDEGPALNVPLAESAAAVGATAVHLIGGFVAPAGGDPVVQYVNFTTEETAVMTDPYPLPAHHVQAARIGRVLYAFGGYVGGVPVPGTPVMAGGWPRTDLAFRFDFAATPEPAWVPIAPLPAPRAAGAAAVLDGQVYIVGGSANDGFPASVLRYDPAADSYTEVAPLPVPRDHLNLIAHDGRLYAVAGRVLVAGQGYDDLDAFEVYDPGTDTWTSLPPVPLARGGQAAAVMHGRLVVAGGEVAEGAFDVFDDVHAYDLANGTWSHLPSMPEARHGGLLAGAAGGDELFYLGGARLDGTLAAESLRLGPRPF